MRGVGKIWFGVFLLVLFSAGTCSDGNVESSKMDKKPDMYREMENEFVNDELSVETLSAFEKRAIQKLKDVEDFISIYSDSSLSMPFRMQAKQMIEGNFINKEAALEFYRNMEIKEDTVNRFLFFSGNIGKYKVEINKITVSNRLQKVSPANYSGEIQFLQKVTEPDSVNNGPANYFQRKIEIQAIRTEKKFGNSPKIVWEVFLGETEL